MSKKSTEAGALAMANNIGDNPIKYADLTEVLERLGAGCLTIIVGHVEAIIAAALPHLEIEAQQAYEAETLSTAQMAKRITDMEAECTRMHSLWHGAEEKLNVYRESLDNYDVTVKNLEDVLCKKRSEIDRLKNELIIAYTPESRNDHDL